MNMIDTASPKTIDQIRAAVRDGTFEERLTALQNLGLRSASLEEPGFWFRMGDQKWWVTTDDTSR